VQSNLTVRVTYATEYLFSVAATSGGSISGPSGGWVDPGTAATLTAVPAPYYHFVGWVGTGSGSLSTNATMPTISLTVNGPVTETAQFGANPPPAKVYYHLDIEETGLPGGTAWNATVLNGPGSVNSTSAITLEGLNGSYTLAIPIAYGATGVRYLPENVTLYTKTISIAANTSLQVNFTTQYLLTVTVTGAGAASPGTEWVDSGSSVSLTASPNASWSFSGWSGSETGTSANLPVTVTGPVTVTATFAPVYTQVVQTDQSQGQLESFGLLAALLVVGIVVGFLMRRGSRGGRSDEPADRESSPASVSEVAPAEEDAAAPEEGSGTEPL